MAVEAGTKSQPMVIISALVAVVLIHIYLHPDSGKEAIRYQGESFVLRHTYEDEDEFEEDPDNYTPQQLKRIEKILTEFELPEAIPSVSLLNTVAINLMVPGYGLSSRSISTDSGEVLFYSIEIPQTGKDRVLVYLDSEERKMVLRLDDFITDEDFGMPNIEIKGNELLYLDRVSGKLQRQIDLTIP